MSDRPADAARATTAAAGRDGVPAPARLRTALQEHPLVLAGTHPLLSWEPPAELAADRVQIAWDGDVQGATGWLPCRDAWLPWPGPALASDCDLRWRLRLGDGVPVTPWSAWAACSTGPDALRWPAQWLQPDARHGAPVLRCRLRLPADAVRATWYVAACGIAVLRVDGRRLDAPGLADYQQDPRHGIEFRAYDLPLPAAGACVGTIELGGGFHERHGHGPRAVSSFIRVRGADGRRHDRGVAAADWEWCPGAVQSDDPYDGVCVDARLRPAPDDPRWTRCAAAPAPAAPLLAALAPPPGVVERRAPRRVLVNHASCRVLDFGGNLVGGLQVDGPLRAGRVLTLRFAEECTAQGHLLIRGNRQALATDRCIGDGTVLDLTPDFSQRGFRYCEVSVHGDWQDEVVLSGLACHDAAEPAATFACSHAGLTELFAACVRTFRQNLAGLLRDCPQRDERLGWLGDAHAVMPAVIQCTDSAAILARWLRLIAQTQDPGSGRRTAAMAPAEPFHLHRRRDPRARAACAQADNVYTAAGTLLPLQYLQATGDRATVAALLPGIRQHLATWPRRPDWPGIDASTHGDHAAFPVDDGPRTPKPLVSQAMLLSELRAALMLCAACDQDAGGLAAQEAALAAQMARAWGEACRDPASSQGTLALGAELGLAPLDPVLAALDERLARDRYHVGTGIILTRTLLAVLGRHQRRHLAWRLVTQPGQPGWLWMLADGGGTLHENLVDTWGFVSRNQPALGAVAEWLLRDVLGLRALDAGALPGRRWACAPPDIPGLDWARGSVRTSWGTISVDWSRAADGRIRCRHQAPAAIAWVAGG